MTDERFEPSSSRSLKAKSGENHRAARRAAGAVIVAPLWYVGYAAIVFWFYAPESIKSFNDVFAYVFMGTMTSLMVAGGVWIAFGLRRRERFKAAWTLMTILMVIFSGASIALSVVGLGERFQRRPILLLLADAILGFAIVIWGMMQIRRFQREKALPREI